MKFRHLFLMILHEISMTHCKVGKILNIDYNICEGNILRVSVISYEIK